MKVFLIILLLISGQYAFAMGDPNLHILRMTPSEQRHLNDMTETTYRTGRWADERGYMDQQMMEENPEQIEEEIQENKIRDEELMEESQLPPDTIKVNRE